VLLHASLAHPQLLLSPDLLNAHLDKGNARRVNTSVAAIVSHVRLDITANLVPQNVRRVMRTRTLVKALRHAFLARPLLLPSLDLLNVLLEKGNARRVNTSVATIVSNATLELTANLGPQSVHRVTKTHSLLLVRRSAHLVVLAAPPDPALHTVSARARIIMGVDTLMVITPIKTVIVITPVITPMVITHPQDVAVGELD